MKFIRTQQLRQFSREQALGDSGVLTGRNGCRSGLRVGGDLTQEFPNFSVSNP